MSDTTVLHLLWSVGATYLMIVLFARTLYLPFFYALEVVMDEGEEDYKIERVLLKPKPIRLVVIDEVVYILPGIVILL